MPSVANVTAQLERWVAGDDAVKFYDLVIHLPDGLDEKLVEKSLRRFLRSRPHHGDHTIGVAGRQLNPSYLEVFLRVVAKQASSPLRFAALATPASGTPSERARQLGKNLKMTQQLGVFSMSRSQAAARARAFAKDPHFVTAAQTIVQAARFRPGRTFHFWTLVDVLLNDGSPESMDALLPLTARALKKRKGDEFEVLRELVHRVKSPGAGTIALKAALGSLPRTSR
ncbi:MAG: hypothetical protein U0228_21430 [Myxococcaceae bacterium]